MPFLIRNGLVTISLCFGSDCSQPPGFLFSRYVIFILKKTDTVSALRPLIFIIIIIKCIVPLYIGDKPENKSRKGLSKSPLKTFRVTLN